MDDNTLCTIVLHKDGEIEWVAAAGESEHKDVRGMWAVYMMIVLKPEELAKLAATLTDDDYDKLFGTTEQLH